MLSLFYRLLNLFYRFIFGSDYLLHTPFFLTPSDSVFTAQCQFADYCLSFLPSPDGRIMLDVGCGNGRLSMHILEKYKPALFYGIDIVGAQISMANSHVKPTHKPFIRFFVDDAQQLGTIPDHSIDMAICLESALHYPDKQKFLHQLRRVLIPGGHFMIADLLLPPRRTLSRWERIFQLHNWSANQYLDAFSQSGFQIHRHIELREVLRSSLDQLIRRSVREIRVRRPIASLWILPLVIPFLWLYLRQLKNNFEYHLFAGTVD